MSLQQITDTILMVRPAAFGYNEETAVNNAFQTKDDSLSANDIQQKALEEFDAFVAKLQAAGVEVIVVEDLPEPHTPDAIFPNNWVTFHESGRVVTYPMFSTIRRKERRMDILERLEQHFEINDHFHLENREADEIYLEGTGSLILDRPNEIMYACLSPRTHRKLVEEFARKLAYEPIIFTAIDDEGQEIYHTNVMMALGEDFAIICLDVIEDIIERQDVIEAIENSGKEIIEISMDQMLDFAGNMLQVKSKDGKTYLVMSETAYESLYEDQLEKIEEYTEILYSSIPTIETFGGGSVRCMMAEVFLPRKKGI